MPRYIDADALTRRIYGEERPELYDGAQEVEWIEKCIDSAPTISPDEVRGVGKWIQVIEEDGTCSKCSCCGEGYYIRFLPPFYYCPNCGAKMEVSEDA